MKNARLLQLAATLGDHLTQFARDDKPRSPLGTGATGYVVGGPAGGVMALKNHGDFQKAGKVYRKRDAAKDAGKGALASGGTAVGTIAGAAALARARKHLPKGGALRKAAVGTQRLIKKSPGKLGVAAGLAGVAAGAAVQNRSAKKRLKEAKSVHGLAAMIEERLHEFGAVDLRSDGSSYYDSCNPSYPSLWISNRKDKGIMDLPSEGKAMVSYKVRRRNIDESSSDGVPRYGADIDIRTIEAVPDEVEEEGTKLSAKGVYRTIDGDGVRGAAFLHEFAGERDRDGAGRFTQGSVANPDQMRLAYGPKKKAAVAGVAGALAAGGVAAAVSPKARQTVTRAGKSLLAGASRLALK